MRGTVNKVILLGRMGQDPEVSYTASGTCVAKFSLATNHKVGEEEKTEWHNLVAFGKTAEVIGEFLTKGSQIYVDGRLQTSSWEKDGVKRYKTEVIVNQLEMLDRQNKDEEPEEKPAEQVIESDEDDDLPF